jgi:hypothetical protein
MMDKSNGQSGSNFYLIDHFNASASNSLANSGKKGSFNSSQKLPTANQNQTGQVNGSASNCNTKPTSWSSVVAASTNRQSSTTSSTNSNNSNGSQANDLNESSSSSSLTGHNNPLMQHTFSIGSGHGGGGSSSSSSTTMEQQNDSAFSLDDSQSNLLSLQQSHAQQQLTSTTSATLPARSQIKRTKMIYSCKFGEFGVAENLMSDFSETTQARSPCMNFFREEKRCLNGLSRRSRIRF